MENKSNNIIFSILQEHPSVAGGVCVFAVAFALVAGNALYSQASGHPLPIMSTRDHTTTQSIPSKSTFKVQPRQVKVSSHKPKTIPMPTARTEKKVIKPKIPYSALVAEIQQGLIDSGDFSGSADGKLGPITTAAIMAYQTRNGFPADGKPTKMLLKVIELNSPQVISRTLNDDLGSLVKKGSVNTAKPTYNPRLVSKIQSGLANFGEKDISVDGIYGKQTAAAITRFQKMFNMPQTGKPDERLLQALIDKNAIPSGL